MTKRLLKIVDNQFGHGKSFGTGDLQISPENFDWYRGGDKVSDLIVFSESGISSVDNYNEEIKVAFLLESPLIDKKSYINISNPEIYNKFDMVLTFDRNLIKINPDKFKYYPFGGCWIYPEDKIIYNKIKNISIVASEKRNTEGHILRHYIINKFRSSIDGLYGRGYQFVQNKIEALKDYRYSIVIENDNCDAMFSEKIIDCFMTGTIPIYWGCKGKIGDFFNTDGIIQFNNENEFSDIIKNCTEEYYLNNINAIKENFELAKQYCIPEDYMWEQYFKNLLKN